MHFFPLLSKLFLKTFLYDPGREDINLNWQICFLQSLPGIPQKNPQAEQNVDSSRLEKKAFCLDFATNSGSTILCTWIKSETDVKVKEISMKVKENCWSSAGEGQQAAGERRRETRRNKQIAATKHQTLKAEKEDWRT